MNRTLITSPLPETPDDIPPGMLVVTPHFAAAETLCTRRLRLFDIAKNILKQACLEVPSEFESFTYLKRAISFVEPDADPTALAARVRKILQTLLRTGIDKDDLEERGSEQVKQLARIARKYERLLEERSLVDRSALLWRAALLNPEPQSLCVYGYFRARKEEIVFINAIAGDNSVYYLPCGEDPIFEINNKSADWLSTIGGWQIESELPNRDDLGALAARRFVEPFDEVLFTALSFDNVESEVRNVLGRAKSLLIGGGVPEEIAIVVRDSEVYAPILSTISAEYGVAVELRNNVPLSDTLLGSFVECLLTANDTEFEFEATASLLMHPFGPGLTAYEWKTARKNRVTGVDEWSTLSPDLNCLNWQSEAALSEWVECLSDALRRLNVRKKAAAITREIVAYDAFIDALALLRREAAVISRSVFCSTIRELLAATQVPFQPSRGGIPVHNLDTIQGARYNHLFILGMAEGILPAAVVDNPVTDFYERAQLAPCGIEFEEAAEVARWSALSFYFTLTAAEKSITFSVPTTIGDTYKIPSPYFARLGIKPAVGTPAEVSSASEELRLHLRSDSLADEILSRVRKQHDVEFVRESVALADEYDGVIGIAIDPSQMSWSASQFTVLGQCPYRWFAQKVLELKSADEAVTSLTPAVKGGLYHKTLELAVERACETSNLRQAILEVLEECFTLAESDPEVGLPKLDSWPLQRHEHLTAIRKAVTSPKFIEEGAAVVAFEEKFEVVWNNLLVKGRIDRVDRAASGLVAIDYKTSSSVPSGVKNDKGKSNVDIQLAVYSQVALPHLYPDERVKKGLYYSLTKGKVLKSIELDEMPPLGDLVTKLHRLLEAGRFAVDPDVDGNACKYCEFDAMCRKGTRLARKTKVE